MEPVIEVESLTHRYGQQLAVDDISFAVRQGEILGLLGPNGAGKTTTVRLLNGLFPPTAGSIRVLGMDPVRQGNQVRRVCGVLTETPALYERLTARQNLAFFGTLAGMDDRDLAARVEELLAFFELTDRAGSRVETYSKGMKQRLALARALLHRPNLLFLDEPTTGLDPEAAQQVHELVTTIRRRNGHSVLMATHNLFEAQRLCDRLAILSKGRLLAIGSLDELRSQFAPGLTIHIDLLAPITAEQVQSLSAPGLLMLEVADPLRLTMQAPDETSIPPLVTHLAHNGAQIISIERRRASLEEIYFKLQNHHKEGGL